MREHCNNGNTKSLLTQKLRTQRIGTNWEIAELSKSPSAALDSCPPNLPVVVYKTTSWDAAFFDNETFWDNFISKTHKLQNRNNIINHWISISPLYTSTLSTHLPSYSHLKLIISLFSKNSQNLTPFPLIFQSFDFLLSFIFPFSPSLIFSYLSFPFSFF